MRALKFAAAAALALALPGVTQAQNTGNLQIYWIDVEGGASTLFVSPTGESLLFDTGYPDNDRDAKRIFAVAQKAGLKQIDHVVISHWHGDHVGGLPGLAKVIHIGKFYDHGDGVEQADKARLDGYKTIAGSNRKAVKAGDSITLGGGVQVRVVVSEGPVIAQPINGGGPNPLCTNTPQMTPAAPENIRMVGLALNYGNFKMATLGDLDWSRELELVCPVNKLGSINLYTINRHGGLDDSGSPALLGAIKPQVVVINNGPRKGLGQSDDRVKPVNADKATPYEKNSYLRLAKLPGIEGIWQEHKSMIDSDPAHNTNPDMIANLQDRDQADHPANWITASVGRDGKFTVTNSRNNFSKTYTAR